MRPRRHANPTRSRSRHARSYKTLKGAQWKTLTLLTAFLYPGIVFFLFFFLNFFIWGRGSSAAVPFGSNVALISMWFCISVPLVFLGTRRRRAAAAHTRAHHAHATRTPRAHRALTPRNLRTHRIPRTPTFEQHRTSAPHAFLRQAPSSGSSSR